MTEQRREPPAWWPEAYRRLALGVPKAKICRDFKKNARTVLKHLGRQESGEYPPIKEVA